MLVANADPHVLAGGALKGNLPVLHFASAQIFTNWLTTNGTTSPGAWLMFAKKGASSISVTRQESIDAALCEGWIDGQGAVWDDSYFLVRFTPRRPRSNWSQINRTRATELIDLGQMRPCGLAEVNAARGYGRWDAAYPPSSTAEAPPDLQAAIDASPSAADRYAAMSRSERYALILSLSNARQPATRVRRIAALCAPAGEQNPQGSSLKPEAK